MQTQFDAYHKWLGIPPDEQPPSWYRLLGVQQGESDPEVIGSAADGRMAHLKTFSIGPNAPVAQRLLSEVARARIGLLDPRRRAAYDLVLREARPAEADAAEAEKQPSESKQQNLTGRVFGQFRVRERILAGRLGWVYRATHEPSGTLVSLKVLPPKAAGHDELVRRFRREQEVTCKLDHPNLIAGYESGNFEGVDYLVTEYVTGTDLATLVRQHGPLPIDVAVDYTTQAARGLMQLHLHGVYHRNVKPHVLLIDMRGQVKITNLFLAKIDEHAALDGASDELTQMGQTMGTPEYLAPEQAADARTADQRADIYSLGCTLHFLLTGKPPYAGKSMMDKLAAHRTQPIPSLRQQRADVPTHIDRAFQKMLSKDPAGRYTFMGDVASALEPRRRAWLPRWLTRWLTPRGTNG